MNLLLEKVEMFPKKQENGKIIKHIYFNFPVWYEDEEIFGIGWKSESRGEAVALLSKTKNKITRNTERNRSLKKLLITILKIVVFVMGWTVLSGIIDVPSKNPAI
ncbi:MAG: hypothetical protein IJV62_03050 [Eggerthellaceae bacterium]|nr:hypothetical protein [Eggerthellaceae bacterium]